MADQEGERSRGWQELRGEYKSASLPVTIGPGQRLLKHGFVGTWVLLGPQVSFVGISISARELSFLKAKIFTPKLGLLLRHYQHSLYL